MSENKDGLIKAQNELIGVLFEIIKRLQSNNDLDTEYFQIIGKEEKTETENMRLDEIQGEKKLKEEDLQYIEQEFNNIVLEEGYVSLFNFLKLKEFFKLITAEDS